MIVLVLPDIPEEDHLLARARQGDQESLRLIYESYFSPVYQFVRMRVNEREIAEDLASDVFVRLITACRGRNAPRHSLRGWLFRVARNVIHDHYGKQQRLTETVLEEWIPASSDAEPEIQFMRGLDIRRIREAIRRLAPDQQEVIVLRFGQALSLQETADLMAKSITAVKSLQFRAVNSLRRVLGEMRMEGAHG